VDGADGAAAAVRAALDLGTTSTLLLCNPVPSGLAMDGREVAEATRRAEERAAADGVRGPDLTPFLLARLAEETGGRSLEANLGLLEANAAVAAEVALLASTANG
jgi:pseudouridine-5'-phosphate glycosidase